jgi:hypothetical protein
MSFGPCLGQQLPYLEVCGGTDDEDCNGVSNEHCAAWAKRFGNSASQHGFAVAVDAQDNVIFTGDMGGNANFGGGTLTSGGGLDIFVAKLDTDGNHLWSRRYGDAAAQTARAVAVDPSGNVIVAGGFEGELAIGAPALSLTSAGLDDIFVIKLDPLGSPLWSKRFGSAADQNAYAVAVGADGSIVVTGEFAGTVDFGGGPLTSAELLDGFVVKLAADGSHLWSRRFGGPDNDVGFAVTTDAASDVYVTGRFAESFDLSGSPVADGGGTDGFIAKLAAATGTHVWSRTFGPEGDQEGEGVAIGPAGEVFVSGAFEIALDFGTGPTPSTGGFDGFATKFDPQGTVVWTKTFTGMNDQDADWIAVDAAGNIAVTGDYTGTADFGGGPQTALGLGDMYFAVFDAGGMYRYSRSFGDVQDQDPFGIAFDGQGSLLLVGEMEGTVDFGPGPITSGGGNDIFIAKIPP